MFLLSDADTVSGKDRQTTIRLAPSQISIKQMPNPSRSNWVQQALSEFLSWETYIGTDWVDLDPQDGNVWLDAVEMGVEYRTRTKLLAPVKLNIKSEIAERLDVAEKIVERKRPNLKGKGISSGIIRTAITQKLYNEVSEDHI